MTARIAAQAMAAALRPFVHSAAIAAEAANNCAAALSIADGADATEVARGILAHRIRFFSLQVGDLEMAATCMGRAWHRATTPEMAVSL